MVLYIDGNYPLHSLHRELVSGLADLGNEMTVFVPMKGKELDGKYNSDHENVHIIYSDILNNLDRVFFLNKIRRIASEIEKNVEMSKVDCILAGTVYSDGGVAYLLHKKYKIPYSVAVRETDVTYHMKWRHYLDSFAKKVLDASTNIIFLSPSYRKYLGKFNCDQTKFITIPNGVNDFWFKGERIQRKIHSPLSLIFVGEICKRKNVTAVISTVSELWRSGTPTVLHIVGAGNEEQRCRDMANQLGIADSVFFHGWQNSKGEIKKYYDQADIFVMPSLRETFGTVYIEALSQGLPVIYTQGQGIDGYFEQGTVGYACDPHNIDEMKKAITLIGEKYESITTACILSSKNFQWHVIARHYNNVIIRMKNK